MKCIHNDLIKASPIFSCCNWVKFDYLYNLGIPML